MSQAYISSCGVVRRARTARFVLGLYIDALQDVAWIAAQGAPMISDQAFDGIDGGSPEWRAALIEVEAARQQYARVVGAADSEDVEVDIVWLRLWRAERHRDELIKL